MMDSSMATPFQVPLNDRPLVIYDGDCSFCKFWVGYWKSVTGERVSYAPFQEVAGQFPEIPLENFRAAAHFVDGQGNVSKGAEAMFRSLACSPDRQWPLWCYLHIPGLAPVSEIAYRFVARHRGGLHRLSRLCWGQRLERARYALTRSLTMRLIGVIYLIAFASWLPQVRGLIGERGISPAARYLSSVHSDLGTRAYYFLPTLAWLHPTDRFLETLTGAGIALSIPVILGIATGPCLLLLWALYLSQVLIGQEFMSFQWDALLLEAGFLSIFFASWKLTRRSALRSVPESVAAPSVTMVWLFRWLVFRVFFLSGVVKLASGDASWRNLTALAVHYQTQPLPNTIAWWMFQLPLWFQQFSTAFVLYLELVVPLLIFAPRRMRHGAASLLLLLQALILLTGNYCFFNWLTIVLCLLLFDDAWFLSRLPQAVRARVESAMDSATMSGPARSMRSMRSTRSMRSMSRRAVTACLAVVLVALSLVQIAERFGIEVPVTPSRIFDPLEPFHLAGSYGLFAVMTTVRSEIIFEGSDDAQTWLPYEFKYKPGKLDRRPSEVAPHQPRLDWQMWFAALGSYRDSPWIVNLAIRLMEGSPDVLKLLETNPFPDHPPHYVRALLYDYRFTTLNERKDSGNWWAREFLGSYLPVVSLK